MRTSEAAITIRRERGGWGLVAMLLAMLIIAWLWVRQAHVLLTPTAKKGQSPQTTLDTAREEAFQITATQARDALQAQDTTNGPPPRTWADFGKLGLDVAQEDPWGGRYFIKDGILHCSGNPKATFKLW